MSWDHYYYEATCKNCGAKGYKIESSDDWSNHEISWEGFETYTDFPDYEYQVERKRIDRNQYAKCACGSKDIEVGTSIVKRK